MERDESVDQLIEMVKGYTRDQIAPTAKDVIDVRLLIDGILTAHSATDTDLKALAENVSRLWGGWGADNGRLYALEDQVRALRRTLIFTDGLLIGVVLLGLVLLGLGALKTAFGQ